MTYYVIYLHYNYWMITKLSANIIIWLFLSNIDVWCFLWNSYHNLLLLHSDAWCSVPVQWKHNFFHLEFCSALIFLLPFHIYCFYGYLRCSKDRILCPFALLATAVLAFDHALGLTKVGYDLPTLKVLLLAVQNLNHAVCHLLYLEVCLVLILHSLWLLLIYP